jgi:hypothetical protein
VALANTANKISDKAINVTHKTERLSPETLRKRLNIFSTVWSQQDTSFYFASLVLSRILFVMFQWLM